MPSRRRPRPPQDRPRPGTAGRPEERPAAATGPPGGGPAPVVTWTILAVCTAVFLLGPAAGLNPLHGTGHARLCAQALWFERWGVVPARLWHDGPVPAAALPTGCRAAQGPLPVAALSVLTALFVHGSWVHLLGNMLFLHVFGPGVEARTGRARFALFYLLAGYAATYGYALGGAGAGQTLVGASGAIAGVLGAYLLLHPRARVTGLFPFLLFLPLRLPAWLVLGFWFAVQWLAARTGPAGPGVAYLAHVTGFAFGFLCAAVLRWQRSKLTPQSATRGDSHP